ncbi:MAG: hypothetical protein WC586_06680 [Methanoregula sp.]
MTDKKSRPILISGIGTAIILTLGAYFLLIFWIWKSDSLLQINIYDTFLLLIGVIVTGILAGLYFQNRNTKDHQYDRVVFGSILFGIWLFLIIPVGSLAYLSTSPASYHYVISINGLDHYTGGLTTDIIVPLPMKDNVSIIPEDGLQYRHFGKWTSMLVMTPRGKMLAFQTGDKNLTDIHADFLVKLESPSLFSDAKKSVLYPMITIPVEESAYPAYNSHTISAYSTQVYIDKNIEPVHSGNNSVRMNLKFYIHEGMLFGRSGENYQQVISEDIDGERNGMIPMRTQITRSTLTDLSEEYLEYETQFR